MMDAALAQGIPAQLPSHEVSGDLAMLAQRLGSATSSGGSGNVAPGSPDAAPTAAAAASASFCRLLASVLRSQQQLQLAPQAVSCISSSLRQWLDLDLQDRPGGAAAAPGPAERLQSDALSAAAELLPRHMQRLAPAERAALLAALAALLPAPATAPAPAARGASAPAASQAAPADVQRQAAAILGTLCKAEAGGSSTGPGGSSSSSSSSNGSKLTDQELAAALRALVNALTVCCSGGGAAFAGGRSSGKRPVEDVRHARLYGQLLRSCTAAVAASRKGWGQHAGAVCEALRRLLQYGAHPAASAPAPPVAPSAPASPAGKTGALRSAPPSPQAAASGAPARAPPQPGALGEGGGGGAVRYVPPHLRSKGGGSMAAGSANQPAASLAPAQAQASLEAPGTPPRQQQRQQQQQEQQQQQQGPPRRGQRASWDDDGDASASESDGGWSDAEGGRPLLAWRGGGGRGAREPADGSGDPFEAAALRVRLAALLLLQAMAQADPPALHPHWPSILPASAAGAPLAPRPLSPHLLTVLLHDPSPRVRALAAAVAAALLQGPQARALLAVAEARGAPVGGAGGGGVSAGRAAAQPRGFTTLSASLGQTLLALHLGLAAAACGADCGIAPLCGRAGSGQGGGTAAAAAAAAAAAG
ncbi:hypothetical protein MNEG_12422 [Monoraphidium neglectum]|uniref:DUF4042 domain-containing protein n=1 Tax=Monoraphidium neglectum TaxID=145388 RepID=A0A0D2LVE4_9CHLO|nr:hypothetical protein MNEG_12422 [Monoraphidium neglectum]KIY95539.1 hypothetical protein MNEG_12422 [Monoraphidium neglectum]|eukprot:XP_013894559.1 hypothetical protein MNEG_12422 [Monoraphidium neglectum]